MAIELATQKELGEQLISITKVLIDIKLGIRQEKSDLYFGFAMGILFALGKAEGFGSSDKDSMLTYINGVLADIFEDAIPLDLRKDTETYIVQ